MIIVMESNLEPHIRGETVKATLPSNGFGWAPSSKVPLRASHVPWGNILNGKKKKKGGPE